MSSIVLGVAASHSTLMNTHWDEVDHLPRIEVGPERPLFLGPVRPA